MAYGETIRNYAMAVLGSLDVSQTELLMAVCQAAEAELMARARPDVTAQQCQETLVMAATLLTVSTMERLNSLGVSDFTAGTLRLSFSEDDSWMAKAAYRMMEPWGGGGFAFRGVRA